MSTCDMTSDQSMVEPVTRKGLISNSLNSFTWNQAVKENPGGVAVRHWCCGQTCVGLAISDAGQN